MLRVNFKLVRRFLKAKLCGKNKRNEPQLLMHYPHKTPPSIVPPRGGYTLRSHRQGDAEGMVDLLNSNGQLGVWDRARIRSQIEARVVDGGQLCVVHSEQIVALANVQDREIFGVNSWEIGWVASHPEHRGKGLGRWVTAAAIEVALALPLRPIVLQTDAYRIPAIKVYLKLGFLPSNDHVSYPHRWQKVFLTLGEDYAAFNRPIAEGVSS